MFDYLPPIKRVTRGKLLRLHHDFETYCDLDLRAVGADAYSRHPSCEPLMCAYALDDRPVKQWVPAEGQLIPNELEDALLDERVTKFAWNKPFEYSIWKNALGIEIPHHQWRDPMVLALSLSLPGSLDDAGKVLRLPPEFLKSAGATLINWFCKPRKPTKTKPQRRVYWYQKYDKWLDFLAYNRGDVEAERKAWRVMRKYDLPPEEWDLWVLDQEINQSGIPINLEMAKNAIELVRDFKAAMRKQMEELTGLDNPNSGPQFLPWAKDHGYRFDDLKRGHVRRGVDKAVEDGNHKLAQALRLRLRASRSSITKYAKLVSHADHEAGVIRNCFQFAGAGRTNRWAGRTLQAQNLAKPVPELEGIKWEKRDGIKWAVGGPQIEVAKHIRCYDWEEFQYLYASPVDALSAGVRTVIEAPPGWVFLDADLRAIENVVLGWMAGDRRILRVFEEDLDPYVDFATYLYGMTYEAIMAEVLAGDKKKRTVAKPGVLGCFARDTEVKTDKGWVPIEHVNARMLVHDGVDFVTTDGVVNQGRKEVVHLDGVFATPDHLVLQARNYWARADDVDLTTAYMVGRGALPSGFQPQQIRPVVGELETFDLLNCGPRNRFVIRTTKGELVVHNCGYMLSAGKEYVDYRTGEVEATGLMGYGRNMGVFLTQEQADLSVKTWRATFRDAVKFWKTIERAAIACVSQKRPTVAGPVKFFVDGPFLRMRLPSGRCLSYLRPKLWETEMPWGDTKLALHYEGKNEKGIWDIVQTHPGKLTENADQAIARDLLASGLMRARQKGLMTVMHVHDQIVAMVRERDADRALRVLLECMGARPHWAPTIPMSAAGHISRFFLKD